MTAIEQLGKEISKAGEPIVTILKRMVVIALGKEGVARK